VVFLTPLYLFGELRRSITPSAGEKLPGIFHRAGEPHVRTDLNSPVIPTGIFSFQPYCFSGVIALTYPYFLVALFPLPEAPP